MAEERSRKKKGDGTRVRRTKSERGEITLDWEVGVGGRKEGIGEGTGREKKGWRERLASLKSSNPLTSVAGAKMEDHTAF